MSTRLDQALAEIADAAGHASRLAAPGDATATATVHRITARVRRRRAARATAGGAVAASAVGAVALVGPTLQGSVVASRPEAPLGTCGSSLADVRPDPSSDVVLRVFPAGAAGVAGGPAGSDLGTWAGDVVAVEVEEQVEPGDGRAPAEAALDLLVTDGDVVVGTVGTSVDRLVDYGHALDGDASAPARAWAAGGVEVPLEDCDAGDRLPAGPYTVWTLRTPEDGAPELTGPWPIDVAPAPREVGDLPQDFPRDLPVVGDRIVSVGPHGAGWGIEVTAQGEDRAAVAALTLLDAGAVGRNVNLGDDVLRTPSGWDVVVHASTSPDGEESVVYVVQPAR
ncbi:hypothetical protein ACFUMH_14790 [Cellulomonas sp. NPDC057328]|uniref:hypothetical protein n=1 Tax=Cellulomonas sp. NPDC057328 TaxID=3346101 RepID=UPI00362D6E08